MSSDSKAVFMSNWNDVNAGAWLCFAATVTKGICSVSQSSNFNTDPFHVISSFSF